MLIALDKQRNHFTNGSHRGQAKRRRGTSSSGRKEHTCKCTTEAERTTRIR